MGTLHKDLHVFLSVKVTGWEIPVWEVPAAQPHGGILHDNTITQPGWSYSSHSSKGQCPRQMTSLAPQLKVKLWWTC
jgi:hypothetical protein